MMMAPPVARPRSEAKAQPPLRAPARPIARPHGMLQRKCACDAEASGGGTCASCAGKEDSLQRKLAIGSANDPLEREADRVADQVLANRSPSYFAPTPISIQRFAPGQAQQAQDAPSSVDRTLAMSGRPLDAPLRRDMETRFGHDFSAVRVHEGSQAEQSARAVGASAYTVRKHVVFGTALFQPQAAAGRRLLAHELAHVVQQGQAEPTLRRQGEGEDKEKEKHLKDYNDTDPKHEPSQLTDAQIEETVEFKTFMDPKQTWQSKHKVTRKQALLASRLILRELRDGRKVEGDSATLKFMLAARRQLGVLNAAIDNVGNFEWTFFENTKAIKGNESTMQSDFARWLLANEQEPDSTTAKINCWEMVLFSAYKTRYITKDRLQTMYVDGVKKMKEDVQKKKDNEIKKQNAAIKKQNIGIKTNDNLVTNMGQVFEKNLRGSKTHVWDPAKLDSAEPLPGDIVVFGEANTHVAISVGTTKQKDGKKKHHIISHGLHPDGKNMTKRTTIEEILPFVKKPVVVKFWRPNW